MKSRCLVLMVFWLCVGVAWGANTHGKRSQQEEMQAWFHDSQPPFVYSDCLPAEPVSGLNIAPFACNAYVRDTTRNELIYVTQSAVGITVPNNTPVWLAVCQDRFTVPSGWTTVQGTHYRFRQNPSIPTTPAGCLIHTRVEVAGGQITQVVPFAFRSPTDAALGIHSVTNWGAVGDDSTDNAATFNRIFLATMVPERKVFEASRSAGRVFLDHVPDSPNIYQIHSEVNWQGASLFGQHADMVSVKVVGDGVRGFYVDALTPHPITGQTRQDLDAVWSGFTLQGSNFAPGGTGPLLQLDNGINFRFDAMNVNSCGNTCVAFDFAQVITVTNSRFHKCQDSCLWFTNFANGITMINNWFEADTGLQEFRDGAVRVTQSSQLTFINNQIECVGANRGDYGLVLDGARELTWLNGFIEECNLAPVFARTNLSENIRFRGGNFNGIVPTRFLDFSGSLQHVNIDIQNVRFSGVAGGTIRFNPGASVSYRFSYSRTGDDNENLGTYVQGFPNSQRHVIKTPPGELTLHLEGTAYGGTSQTIGATGSTLALTSSDAAGQITLSAGGTTKATVAGNSPGLVLEKVAFGSLGTPTTPNMVICTGCSVTSSSDNTCASVGGGNESLALRLEIGSVTRWVCLNLQNAP